MVSTPEGTKDVLKEFFIRRQAGPWTEAMQRYPISLFFFLDFLMNFSVTFVKSVKLFNPLPTAPLQHVN